MAEKIKHPKDSKLEGASYVRFVIDAKGKLADIEFKKSLGKEFDAAIIAVLEAMPDWVPAQKGGQALACDFVLPVRFAR